MLERQNVFLGGCRSRGVQDGDCIETLNKSRNALEKEGALAVIICVFSDAPSQVAQEVHPCLVDRSHGLDCDCDRHKQVGLAEYGIFARLPVCCRLCQGSGTSPRGLGRRWDVRRR